MVMQHCAVIEETYRIPICGSLECHYMKVLLHVNIKCGPIFALFCGLITNGIIVGKCKLQEIKKS
jgi:hypothetical protein